MGFSALEAPAWVKYALSLGRQDELHAAPPVARFSEDEGGGFVLDRTHHPALLKFDDSPEVWAVSASRGPRGDVLFRNDIGDILLRVTKVGGVTVFTSRWPSGVAASLEGPTSPLKSASMDAQALYQRMLLASSRCTRVAHHLVAFDAPEVDLHTAAPIGEAVLSVMDAITKLAAQPAGRPALSRLIRVTFASAPTPTAWWRGGELYVFVNPNDGLSGHPSSARITQVLEGP
jgi:hypothetical protein